MNAHAPAASILESAGVSPERARQILGKLGLSVFF